jgi:hypothetical protein
MCDGWKMTLGLLEVQRLNRASRSVYSEYYAVELNDHVGARLRSVVLYCQLFEVDYVPNASATDDSGSPRCKR